jgi:preprotein translocase subunit SecG
MIFIDYIAIFATVFLIITVLLQQSSDNISDAFSGEKSELFKERKTRGLELFLSRSSYILIFIIVLAILLSNNLR